MDLLVPCIEEGRSKLRKSESCDMPSIIHAVHALSWLRITLLTERMYAGAFHMYYRPISSACARVQLIVHWLRVHAHIFDRMCVRTCATSFSRMPRIYPVLT